MQSTRELRRLIPLRHPAQFVVFAFAGTILLGSLLLLIPAARAEAGSAPPLVALFTATSAVCLTGLIVVDTPTYWSPFGHAVIMGLIQIGGFGIMTLASLLVVVVSRRLGLRSRIVAQAETKAFGLGDVRSVVVGVASVSLFFEAIVAVLIGFRLWASHGYPGGRAAWFGLFHAISSFNNAGFALLSDSLQGFVTDPWMNLTVAAAVILGGVGFPVLRDVGRTRLRPERWSVHTKMTVAMTVVLLVAGTAAVLVLEWSNPATVGPFGSGEKLMAGFFQSVTSRTAGFNTVDIGSMHETSWLLTCVLMFIGGGSAGTAGGIKVTTFALLGFVMWAEARGEPNVTALGRRIPVGTQRQALTVALLAVGAVVGSTLALMVTGGFELAEALFETVSAFGTVGLSTGLTPDVPDLGRLVLIVLMFTGRLGPITLASALALRERQRRYLLPEGRPIIG